MGLQQQNSKQTLLCPKAVSCVITIYNCIYRRIVNGYSQKRFPAKK
jgi:hypothetical protein